MSRPTRALLEIAQEVKTLHDQDEALSKARVKTKVEQRDVRLRIGQLVSQVHTHDLDTVAHKSGYTVARLKDFALVRTAWPEGTYPADASYTPLEELARDPERFAKIKAGMSKRDARAARGGKVDTPSRWSPSVKAAFIREAMADPAVASEVAGDQAARAAMAEAQWRHRQQRRQRQESLNPGLKQQRESTERAEFLRQLDNLRYDAAKAVDRAMALDAAGDAEAIEIVAEIKNAVEWLDSYIQGGSTTFESDLTRLLEGN